MDCVRVCNNGCRIISDCGSAMSCRNVPCVCAWEKSLTTSGLDMVSHYIIVYRLAFLDPLIGDVNRVVLLHCFDFFMWQVCEYAMDAE